MFTQENGGECFADRRNLYYTATNRFVFYQAGKCLVQTLLLNQSKNSVLKLNDGSLRLQPTESKTDLVSSTYKSEAFVRTARTTGGCTAKLCIPLPSVLHSVQGIALSNDKGNSLSNDKALPPIETRTNLETLLIGFYAGKAGELFTAYTQKEYNQHLSSLKYQAKAVIMQPRKRFVRVTGSLTNGITFRWKSSTSTVQAEFHLNKKTQSSLLVNGLIVQKQANLLQDKIKQFLCQSDTGLFERVKATFLAQSIIVNGSISSQNILNFKKNSIVGNLNKTEIKDKRVYDLFQTLEEDLKNTYLQGNSGLIGNALYKNSVFASHNSFNKESVTKSKSVSESSSTGAFQSNNLLESKKINFISQKKEITYKCEEIVCKALTFSIRPYGDWFRIYLPQIETYQRQLLLSDQFFKKRRELGFAPTKLRSTSKESSKKTDTKTSSVDKALLCHKSYLGNLNSKDHNKVLVIPSLRPCTERCCTKTLFLRDKILTSIPTCLWPQELSYDLCHGLVLNTFYRAFNLLGKNRELLDILSDHLIRFEKIRAPEILRICALYVDTANTFAISVD